MKKLILLISILFISIEITYGQQVTIGTQIWSNTNLDVTTYRDGTPIPQVTDPTQWANLTTGAWCYYNNNPANNAIYGKLYNWYAVAGIYDAASAANPSLRKQLAPQGWYVPSDAEWSTLINYLDPNANGGETIPNIAGGKMKSTGTIQAGTGFWQEPNTAATNESGFTGLPAGYRVSGGSFGTIFDYGNWWSSSETNTSDAWNRYLNYNGGTAGRNNTNKANGSSVRCLKDISLSNISLVSGSGNKSTLYPGWTMNNGNYDYPMTTTDGINYTISNIFLTGATNQIGGISADYWVKFRQDNNWTTNWGSTAFPSGVGTQGGANINVTIPGNYSVSLNIQTGAYTFTVLTPAPSISIIGANIGTAWNTDVTLSQTDGYLYYLPAYNLPAGQLKFRQNNSWLTNWGGTTFPTGDGIPNGSNILASPAGVYDINFFKGPTGASYNFSTTLGIDDQNIKTIKIYPNPASTHINIDFNNETDLNGGTIKFINSLGQEVFTRPITLSGTQTSMQLNTWGGTGMYFVQIINPQGQVMYIKKIIIQ